jgi:hypothetical protein
MKLNSKLKSKTFHHFVLICKEDKVQDLKYASATTENTADQA